MYCAALSGFCIAGASIKFVEVHISNIYEREDFRKISVIKDECDYSIIGQGRVEEIINSKPEERRSIFEEAAGIVKYRTRKAESEKKLEQTKLNLLRINDIISEIEGNLEPLKNQSEKAKTFLRLREELKKQSFY